MVKIFTSTSTWLTAIDFMLSRILTSTYLLKFTYLVIYLLAINSLAVAMDLPEFRLNILLSIFFRRSNLHDDVDTK